MPECENNGYEFVMCIVMSHKLHIHHQEVSYRIGMSLCVCTECCVRFACTIFHNYAMKSHWYKCKFSILHRISIIFRFWICIFVSNYIFIILLFFFFCCECVQNRELRAIRSIETILFAAFIVHTCNHYPLMNEWMNGNR